jgi:hypothetical protein
VVKWSGEKRELQDEYLCGESLMRYVLICECWSYLHSVTDESRAALEWAKRIRLSAPWSACDPRRLSQCHLNDRQLLLARSVAILNRRVLSLGVITVIQEADLTQSALKQHKIMQERTVVVHRRKVRATRQISFLLRNAATQHGTGASSSGC